MAILLEMCSFSFQEIMSDRGVSSEEAEKENEWLGKMPKHLIRSKATLVRTFKIYEL